MVAAAAAAGVDLAFSLCSSSVDLAFSLCKPHHCLGVVSLFPDCPGIRAHSAQSQDRSPCTDKMKQTCVLDVFSIHKVLGFMKVF